MPSPDTRPEPISREQVEKFSHLFTGTKPVDSWRSGRPMMAYGTRDGFYERSPYQDEADRIGVPVIPALPDRPGVGDPNPVVAICGACGRKVHQVEMYSCSKGNCPIQPRASF